MIFKRRWKHLAIAATLTVGGGCSITPPIRAINALSDDPVAEAPANGPNRPWHVEFGYHGSHTKLAETKRMLDRRLDIPMKFDVLDVFHHPDTPLDRKSNLSLASIYLAVGRQESDWFVWNLQIGGGGASDQTHQRFLNANLEVSFRYALAYTSLMAEIYPWSVPAPLDEMNWTQRLSASRPFVVTGLQTGYVNGEGQGHYSIAPFRIYGDRERIRDWITAYVAGVGWALPLDGHWTLQLIGDYRFHFYRPDEYDSWTVTTGLRYNF